MTFVLPNCGHACSDLMDILEKRKLMLGVEDMVEMRNQIWKIAQNLILAEGAKVEWPGNMGHHSSELGHLLGGQFAEHLLLVLLWREIVQR